MTTDHVICKCGTTIGEIRTIYGRKMLVINGVYVRALHGICESCGEEVHWSTSENMLHELLLYIQQIKSDI